MHRADFVAAGVSGVLVSSAALFAEPCPPDWSPAFPYDTTLYPFENKCIELSQGTMHYVDESLPGEPGSIVLLLHGNPTWSFLYRDIIPPLVEAGYRVVAPDYYGFGLSDKPALNDFGYTPAEHTDTMEEFILALGLDDMTLVMQDWGGPIGVTLAARHPDRFQAVVIMNTLLQEISADDPSWNHVAVDFSIDNIVNENRYRTTGEFPRNMGNRLGELYGPRGSAEFRAVRDAYWGPFLDLTTGDPLGPDIVAPTNIFAQNLLLSASLLDGVDQSLRTTLNDLPLYMVYGGADPFFGALRCDDNRQPACPDDLTCEARPDDEFCVEPDGDLAFLYVDRLRELWNPRKIYGQIISPDGGHFVQEYEQETIAMAIETVTEIALTNGLSLQPPTPGRAGENNLMIITNATPGHRVALLYSRTPGQTEYPGCPGLTVNLTNPIVADVARADSGGDVVFEAFVPSAARLVDDLRAQAVDLDECFVSNVVFIQFE